MKLKDQRTPIMKQIWNKVSSGKVDLPNENSDEEQSEKGQFKKGKIWKFYFGKGKSERNNTILANQTLKAEL